jgi:hypothetical protein
MLLMQQFMEYLLLLLPISLFGVSYFYKVKYNRFKDTGKVPVILTAKMNTTVYFLLGLAMFCVVFFVIHTMQTV